MIILAILLAICIVVLFCLHNAVNDRSISQKLWNPNKQHTVLAVFAHPDDEVMVAGTLAKVKKAGGKVYTLYLTHGEDGPTGGLVEKANLGQRREQELQKVQQILGVDELVILNYPDRYLNTIDPQVIKNEIAQRIQAYHPDTVICFDSTNGLYGHDDHVMAGRCTQELLQESTLNVEFLLIMTLPNKMIQLAKKVSKTFKERYNDEKGLPPATCSVTISSCCAQKHNVVLAHATQWQVMGDVQPLHNKIPYFIYYRIFSREYYHLQKLTKKDLENS